MVVTGNLFLDNVSYFNYSYFVIWDSDDTI